MKSDRRDEHDRSRDRTDGRSSSKPTDSDRNGSSRNTAEKRSAGSLHQVQRGGVQKPKSDQPFSRYKEKHGNQFQSKREYPQSQSTFRPRPFAVPSDEVHPTGYKSRPFELNSEIMDALPPFLGDSSFIPPDFPVQLFSKPPGLFDQPLLPLPMPKESVSHYPLTLLPEPVSLVGSPGKSNLSTAFGDGLLPLPNKGFQPIVSAISVSREGEALLTPPVFQNTSTTVTLLPVPPVKPVQPLLNPGGSDVVGYAPINEIPPLKPTLTAPAFSSSEMEQVGRFLLNKEYHRLFQFIRDNIREGGMISPTVNQAVIFAVRELTVQMAFAECFQMFRFIPQPTAGMLEALTDMVVEHVDKLRQKEMDIWLPFNKCITWHISTRTPIPPVLIDTMIRCFSVLDSWARIWSALQMCHQSNCLPPTSVSKKTLERLLDAMLYEETGIQDGFLKGDQDTNSSKAKASSVSAPGVSLSLAIHLLEPYLPSAGGVKSQNIESIRCDLLVRVWLRCVDENETEWAHRIGGPSGSLLVPSSVAKTGGLLDPPSANGTNLPPPSLNSSQIQDRETILTVLRNRIAELIITENYAAVVQLMMFGYNFLPELADAFVSNFLMVPDTQKAFGSLMKLVQYKIPGSSAASGQGMEVNRCLAYVCLQLAHSYSDRRQWSLVVELHESIVTNPHSSDLLLTVLPSLSPSFGLQYPLTVLEASLRSKRLPLAKVLLKTFPMVAQTTEDANLRSKRYLMLRDFIESAIVDNDLETATEVFWILQGIYDEDTILECPADVNEIFNDLIVRSCKSGVENTRRALELGRRGMTFAKTRLVVLAFPLRVLLTEAVRQGCCSSVDATGNTPEEQNKRCVFDLAERGFQVAIYPRAEVRMSDIATTQTLFIPTDATTEEIQVILTIYCRTLRQQLLNLVRQNTSTDVLNLCELTIWPQNVGVRDMQLTQMYQLDVSSAGVLKRVEQVLSAPLFLSGPIEFERQSGIMPGSTNVEPKLVVQKFKLYHVVYYSKLD